MIWSTAASPSPVLIACGFQISPSIPPRKARCISPWSLDAWSRRVVGWSIADHLRSELVVDALDMAIWRRRPDPDSKLIHHSDHGTQGEFNWSMQHLDRGGVDGQASWVDEGVDGSVADEVAGCAVAAA